MLPFDESLVVCLCPRKVVWQSSSVSLDVFGRDYEYFKMLIMCLFLGMGMEVWQVYDRILTMQHLCGRTLTV